MVTESQQSPPAKYDDLAVKLMVYPSIFFLVLGMGLGVYLAFNTFVFPDYFSGEYAHFGRIRPVHLGNVLWLWLLSCNVGLLYFIVPRLCGKSLWSIPIAKIAAGLWWFSLLAIIFSYPFGTNYGWEYDELPFWVGFLPAKPIFTIAWILVVINLIMTIVNRIYDKMYVSLWYTLGAVIWTTFNVSMGFYAMDFIPEGISRVNASWFYVHNLVGLTFTPMGVAIAYYFIPKIANTPLYNHRLSLIGFWTIAFTYAWIGTHHMIHGPISQWLQTLSIVFSIWLFIPVWTVVANLFATMKGKWQEFSLSVPLRFLMMGNMFYLMVCIQGPLQSLRNVNEITSKTDYIVAHAHMALFGTFTFFAIPGVYHVVTVMTRKPLWSKALAEWHFSLNMLGTILFFAALFLGGFLQGLQWTSWATGSSYAEFHHNLSALPFLQTVADTRIWWILRGIGGLFIWFGTILFAINMFNTIVLKPREEVTL